MGKRPKLLSDLDPTASGWYFSNAVNKFVNYGKWPQNLDDLRGVLLPYGVNQKVALEVYKESLTTVAARQPLPCP